ENVAAVGDVFPGHHGHHIRQLLGQRLYGLAGADYGQRLELLRRRDACRGQARALLPPGRYVEDYGKLNLQQPQGRGQHPAFGRELQSQRLRTDIDAGRDVLAPVYAIAGGADDFRHVGPDRVETGTMKPAAIPRPGNRDPAGIRLVPGSKDNVGRPVRVANAEEFRVHRNVQQPLGTALNAREAGLAFVQRRARRLRIAVERRLVPVDVVETAKLDAVATAGAVLAPIDIGEFADPAENCGRCGGV